MTELETERVERDVVLVTLTTRNDRDGKQPKKIEFKMFKDMKGDRLHKLVESHYADNKDYTIEFIDAQPFSVWRFVEPV